MRALLTSSLSGWVGTKVQSRGRTYFRAGAVTDLSGDPWKVQATVQGSENYSVSIVRKDDEMEVSCTCAYFLDREDTCKHIWATFLAAEVRGYLQGYGNGASSIVTVEPEYDLPPARGQRAPAPNKEAVKTSKWKSALEDLSQKITSSSISGYAHWPLAREPFYIIDVEDTLEWARGLAIYVGHRDRKQNGQWGKIKYSKVPYGTTSFHDPRDRRILSLLQGAREETPQWSHYSRRYNESSSPLFILPQATLDLIVPLMCATGRCGFRYSYEDQALRLLGWDDGPPWKFSLNVEPGSKEYYLRGRLTRRDEAKPLSEPLLLVQGGLVIFSDQAAKLDDSGAFQWIDFLREHGELSIPMPEAEELVHALLRLPGWSQIVLPQELRFEQVSITPTPKLKLSDVDRWSYRYRAMFIGVLSFRYGDVVVDARDAIQGIYQGEQRRFITRDFQAENKFLRRLKELGFQEARYTSPRELQLSQRHVPKLLSALLEEGWEVEAEGKLYRRPGKLQFEVTSGIDWFEVQGGAQFADIEASLPELLMAIRRGEKIIKLRDGSFGLLPEEWAKQYRLLANLGEVAKDTLRFERDQMGLLDVLLAAEPEVLWDDASRRARDELKRFEGIQVADAPMNFVGQMRNYQREGLGWLYFLQRFGFGGCLADDMGLGKTIQVLALLESRRELRANASRSNDADEEMPGPSLVVVPKSLVFNWQQEAQRFTPKLRILEHAGTTRLKPGEHFEDYDAVLTTYGILRRDAAHFKNIEFDYAILDESQAIKNAGSESAKAVRLLRARHRLALSGTPVENHIGELWSLFEFLNPGMLGSAGLFGKNINSRTLDPATLTLLARALRPFILRRTKEQVAKELPPKVEQTIYCELEPRQRQLYDELRTHYRHRLLPDVERSGVNRNKIQILEALLRLRQAACHPGLLDKSKLAGPSAKFETILEQLGQIIEEGHKALVFSQFTSLLAILRQHLERAAIEYAYLEGRTRNRAEVVERFQSDPDLKLFLISLKAGGLGLNLTAAEYVFLLDPWWNPAVEAQAIDRTHRIGQSRNVFAYRLIAKNTVEEKILELQKTKRDLADAIINENNSIIRNLSRADLELLLS
ncbi:MAG: SNF2-related protein [Candidatus Binatia bacterium]